MIDKIIEKLIKWLISKNYLKQERYNDFDFYFRIMFYNILSMLFIFFINILTNSWKEILIIILVFDFIRIAACGWHAKTLKICLFVSTIYFTLLAITGHLILSSTNTLLPYFLSAVAIISGIYIIKCVPKINKTQLKEILENIKNNPDEELTIKERKILYIKILIVLIILIIIGLFYCKFLCVTLSLGLLSVTMIISNSGEKVFNFIQDIFLKINK